MDLMHLVLLCFSVCVHTDIIYQALVSPNDVPILVTNESHVIVIPHHTVVMNYGLPMCPRKRWPSAGKRLLFQAAAWLHEIYA